MAKKRFVILWLFLCFCFPLIISAETITLKSGKKIEAKVLEKTEQYIKIELNDAPIYYELKYIASIDQDAPFVDANFYLKKSLAYASQLKFKEAEEELKKGLEINSSDHNLQETLKILDGLKGGTIEEEYAVHLFKGADFLMNAKYQEAISEFKEALVFEPDNPDLYYYLGVCKYQLEEYREAVDYLKKALDMKSDTEIYYYLGACHYSLGRYSEAINFLTKVLEADPDDAEAFSIIGTSYYLLGQLQQAKDNLYKAKELFKNKGDYLKANDIENFLDELN